VLQEAKQQLPDGRVRTRGLPLSEKLLGGESWRGAVERAVQEELGSVLACTGGGWRSQVRRELLGAARG